MSSVLFVMATSLPVPSGCIQVSEATYAMLEADQSRLFSPTGGVEVKVRYLITKMNIHFSQ